MPIRLGGRKTLKRLESFLTLWAGGKILLPAPPTKPTAESRSAFTEPAPTRKRTDTNRTRRADLNPG